MHRLTLSDDQLHRKNKREKQVTEQERGGLIQTIVRGCPTGYSSRMSSTFHVVVDAMLKRIRRSPLYYERYNNTHSFRINQAYVRFAREFSARYAAEHGRVDLPPSPLATNAATCLRGVFPPESARAYSEKITEMIARNDEHVNRTAGEENLAVRILSTLQVFGPG